MAHGISLSIISTENGRRRINTHQLTNDSYGQRLQIRRALSAIDKANDTLFDMVEEGPGVEILPHSFLFMTLDERALIANGIDVDLTVMLSLKEAKSRIDTLISTTGKPPELFLELC